MTKEKIGEYCGWLGLMMVQLATIPPTINILMGHSEKAPPMDMVLMVWSGLILYLIRSLIQKDTIFIVSNTIGFFTQSVLLSLIVFK